jgi:hypothetical protein
MGVENEREKPLLSINLVKVVRFLISPNKKKMKIEFNKIMNPAFLLGTAFNIAYWHRKYHSGTICKGVSNPQMKSFRRMKGKNGILLFVFNLKGLLEE